MALLGALWLVVMIATVSARFAATAAERRALGLTAADRARETAALEGALATLLARLDAEGRAASASAARVPTGGAVLTDPWASLEARHGGDLVIGDVTVRAEVLDLGVVRNVNTTGEAELATLIGTALRDAQAGRELAQAIADWRDPDDLARPLGGERAAYERAGRAALPTNAPFRELDDLRDVLGMTPERFDALAPLLTTLGVTDRVNLNAAPEPVLRTLPGLTGPLLAQVLALRAGGRRVESVPALLAAARAAGGGVRREASAAAAQRLFDAATLDVREVLVELRLAAPATASASRLRAVLVRTTDGGVVVAGRRW